MVDAAVGSIACSAGEWLADGLAAVVCWTLSVAVCSEAGEQALVEQAAGFLQQRQQLAKGHLPVAQHPAIEKPTRAASIDWDAFTRTLLHLELA